MSSWIQGLIKRLTAPATPTTPTRTLGVAFQPSVTDTVDAVYTIKQIVLHGQDSVVTLLSDSANPPTTERGSVELALTDDTASITTRQQIVYRVPPGHYVKLVASGTGTPSVQSSSETPAQ